jgi:dipeptidyl aminopeptidase/acylaminoacyl peptidase
MKLRRYWIAICVFAFLAGSADSKPAVNATDLFKVKQISVVHFSPDGKMLVFVVKSMEKKKKDEKKGEKKPEEDTSPKNGEYGYETHLYLAPSDGSVPPRRLTEGDKGASDPSWRPDSKAIAFVRAVNDKPQIFILSLEGGEAWQLTSMETDAQAPRWSPDGKRILFASEIPHHLLAKTLNMKNQEPPWPYERPGRKSADVANWGDPEAKKPKADPDGSVHEVREWLSRNESESNPRVITRLALQGEANLEPELSYSHFFVIDVKPDAKPVAITSGFFSFGGGQWTSDGKQILLSGSVDTKEHPDRVLDSDIFSVDSDGKNFRTILDMKDYAVFAPDPSPDGRSVAFAATPLKQPGFGLTQVGTMTTAASTPHLITEKLDRDVGEFEWARDSKTLFITTSSDGGFPIYRINLSNGEIQRLSDFDTGIRTFDVAANQLAYVLTDAGNPYELYVSALDASHPKRISNLNAEWIAEKEISLPEKRKLTRPDGTIVDYWILKPVPFESGKKYPLMVQMHGGPSAMWGPGEDTMWQEFQLYAGKGFGIVYCNPRGSGGYGYTFKHANYQDWGEDPGEDVLAVASEAAKESWIDPSKQVLTGGSYAGYLTAWIIGHDHRFKAAVAQRGVYELSTFMGEGNAWQLIPWHFGGYPWEEKIRSVLERESPLSYVNQIDTPFLILHGDNDLRTGIVQSEMLYRSLKILNKQVEYVRHPNATHELSRSGDPVQRIDRLLRIYEFMSRFL